MNSPYPCRPDSLAGLDLSRSLLVDLALKHVYIAGEIPTVELARRMGLSVVDLLLPLSELMRRGGLIEPVDAGRLPSERVWGLTAEGRVRAARAFGRSRYAGPVPVTLEAYRREVGRGPAWRPDRDALALLRRMGGLNGEQIEALGTGFASEGLIFIHGPSGSGKTHLLNALTRVLNGTVRIPYAIAAGERLVEVFDPEIHHPAPDAGAAASGDGRWVHCLPPVIRTGAEIAVRMFELRCDPASGRALAPLQIKANGGLLLIDDLESAGPRALELIRRWHMLLDCGVDRIRLPDHSVLEFPISGRIVVASTLDPNPLGGEALVRRLAGRVDLGEWPECAYRPWVESLCRAQGCDAPEEISQWLVGMHRSAGLPRVPGVAARLLQIAHDGARHRGETQPLGRAALERAWQVHRGPPGPAAPRSDPMPRRGTIATPQYRRAPGSIDVRNCQPRRPV